MQPSHLFLLVTVCLPAVGAVEVIWVIGVVLEKQRLLVNDGVTLLTDIFSQSTGFLLVVTGATQMPTDRRKIKGRF